MVAIGGDTASGEVLLKQKGPNEFEYSHLVAIEQVSHRLVQDFLIVDAWQSSHIQPLYWLYILRLVPWSRGVVPLPPV